MAEGLASALGAFGGASLGTLFVRLTADSASLIKGMNQAEKSVLGSVSSMTGMLTTFTAAVITAATAISLKFTKSAIDAADQMGKAAQKAGQTVEAFSALAFSAHLADLNQQDLVMSSKFLSIWLEKNGKDSSNLTDAIAQQADSFSKMEDGSKKLQMAYERFGRSGAQLIPFLNQGSAAIRAQMEEARAFSLVVGPEFAANAQTFNDNLKRIEGMFQGVFNVVAEQLLPVWIELQDRFIAWVKETDAVRVAADAVIASFQTLADIVNYLRLGLLTIWTVLKSVATIIATDVVIKIELLKIAIDSVIRLGGIWGDVLKNIMKALGAMASLIGQVAQTMLDLSHGNLSAALKGSEDIAKGIAKGWDDITSAIGEGVVKSGNLIAESANKSFDTVTSLSMDAVDEIKTQWADWAAEGAKILEPIKVNAKAVQTIVKETTQDIDENSKKLMAALSAMGAPKSRLETAGLTQGTAQGLGVSGDLIKQLQTSFPQQPQTAGLDPLAAQMTQFQSEEQMLKDRLSVLEDLGNQEVDLTEEVQRRKAEAISAFNKQLGQLQVAQQLTLIQSGQNMFDSLATAAEGFAGKQSVLYKSMFAASKAFAIAEAVVKIQQGIASAAALPWPMNLAAIASVIAATASIVSTISSVSLEIGGKRAMGGPVTAGSAFLVGEKGPELMVPSSNGTVVPNNRLGGGDVKVIVNNFTDANAQVTQRQEGEERIVEIVVQKVKSQIASEVRDGRGEVSKAMESSFSLRRGGQ